MGTVMYPAAILNVHRLCFVDMGVTRQFAVAVVSHRPFCLSDFAVFTVIPSYSGDPLGRERFSARVPLIARESKTNHHVQKVVGLKNA